MIKFLKSLLNLISVTHGYRLFESTVLNYLNMVTKQQEYLSSIFKTFGFGFVAPVGSILFQWFLFEKCPYFGHFLFAAIVFCLGIIVMYIGYRFLEDR